MASNLFGNVNAAEARLSLVEYIGKYIRTKFLGTCVNFYTIFNDAGG